MIPSWLRSRSALRGAACVLALALPLAAQCNYKAHVERLGEGCGGAPVPSFNGTQPILGAETTFYVTSSVPNATVWLVAGPPVASPFVLPDGCEVWVDLGTAMFIGPLATNGFGAATLTFTNGNTPDLCGLVCNIQAGIVLPDNTVRVTNGIQATMGCPDDPLNGIPSTAYCSYSKGGYGGSGEPNEILKNNFYAVFPAGLELGDHNPGNGNAAPNGLVFESNLTGLIALENYLPGGGTSGAYTSDQTNGSSSYGGGNLGRQTAALSLNVAFNDAGLTASDDLGFGDLVYVNPGDSLSGLKVRQILVVANAALAGSGLPAGHTFSSLKTVVDEINVSFDDCRQSDWSEGHLFRP